jgi:hypothetical protein
MLMELECFTQALVVGSVVTQYCSWGITYTFISTIVFQRRYHTTVMMKKKKEICGMKG